MPLPILDEAGGLLRRQRWAALATLDEEHRPAASMVAYAVEPEHGALLLHLSRLAEHTRNLLERPRVSLTVTETDDGREDPQTLARLGIRCIAEAIPRESDAYRSARRCYLGRLPASEPLFGFADFVLFRLHVEEVRYVGGFARAHTITGERLKGLFSN